MSPPFAPLSAEGKAAKVENRPGLELRVRLADSGALYGVLAVLHARRVTVERLHLDDHLLRIEMPRAASQLLAQIKRRVDVLEAGLHPRSEKQ